MPSTIPYDPSLVLGNLVTQDALDNLLAISALQAPIDAAEDTLNSYIALQRSITMTIQELIDMGVDTADLVQQNSDVNDSIQKAAIDYAKVKLDGLLKIQALKGKIQLVHEEIESPIDYNKSAIKPLPLSIDSLKMNAQYFSFDENSQTADTQASSIKGFISGELSRMGTSIQGQASKDAQSQVNSQYENHSIAGTLVISISCTHKMAQVFAPFILDVDKGIRVWNKIFPGDLLKTNDPAAMGQIVAQSATGKEKSMTLLSGATYGSCFIGMVHILNSSSTTSNEQVESSVKSVQMQFKVGGAISKFSGGFGVDKSFSDDAKNLLSNQSITSHCTLVTMGALPSIKSNAVALSVKKFATFDGASAMASIQTLQNATATDADTASSAADAARTGGQMTAMQSTQIKSVLSGLGDIDDQSNKMLDINSMMDAMDDYLTKISGDGFFGVPINYYLKPITKSQLAEMWVSKYYPGQYLSISGDDSTPAAAAAPAS